jgi:GAF domain-containing protein/HAMP domain-containing protein
LQDYFGAFGFIVFVALHATVLVIIVFLYNRDLTQPIASLKRAMQAMSIGNYDAPLPELNRPDELGDLARTFVDMRQETQALVQDLQTRINSRTRDVQATQEISRVAVTQRNLQNLMDDVVALIVERFPNIYHAQIFLVNQDYTYAVLRASTGDAGEKLLARGHRLAVGSISVIGQVTAQGNVIVARDTAASEVHKQNEFLPETRAELAVPLRVGDDIIGALDVQSRESASFDEEQIQVLQIMADQIAVAIENARLYQESVRRIRAVRDRTRDQTIHAWRDYMFDNRRQRLVHQAGYSTNTDIDDLHERALVTGKPAVSDVTDRDTVTLALPLRLRGEIIGVVAWELPAASYDGNQLQLAQDLVERLAASLDNTRLFEQSLRATERERLVNEISTKLTAQTDVSEILQTAIREVGQALRAPQVSIRLNQGQDEQTNN